ncbi:hypothetical protein ANANG_G00298770 [Anguilla anguilla]|uniref:Uncharacterized protein n=1 Tax=Anguilla anguilla TaxID=7936 RepID=A0A9D3LHQ2_ANGAN|nr:hypothetical protein ANANG_G00298770 [Anguilla anguilla]
MPRTRPPTPTPSQPGSPPPHAQTTAQDPTRGITTPGTPNSTAPPAELGPTKLVTVKEELDSDTPIVVLESDSSTSETDSITPWQKIKKRKGKRIRSPTTARQQPPSQPPNPAIVRQTTQPTIDTATFQTGT